MFLTVKNLGLTQTKVKVFYLIIRWPILNTNIHIRARWTITCRRWPCTRNLTSWYVLFAAVTIYANPLIDLVTAQPQSTSNTGIYDPNLGPVDVLQRHWERNRLPVLPQPAISLPLLPSSLPASSSASTAGSPSHPIPSSGSLVQSHPSTRRTRNSRTVTDGTNPRTMAFYPKHWKNVLEWAKQYFRVYIVYDNGFPNNIVGLREAKDLIYKASALYLSQGRGIVESGNIFIILSISQYWLQRLCRAWCQQRYDVASKFLIVISIWFYLTSTVIVRFTLKLLRSVGSWRYSPGRWSLPTP